MNQDPAFYCVICGILDLISSGIFHISQENAKASVANIIISGSVFVCVSNNRADAVDQIKCVVKYGISVYRTSGVVHQKDNGQVLIRSAHHFFHWKHLHE